MFSINQRLEQIRSCTEHLSNVKVDSFTGLTVQYARIHGAGVLLRGLRVLSDFEKELQMAHTNQTLMSEIETVFLATSNEYSFLSSSVVKEIASFGGTVDHLVPENVALDIYQCYAKTHPGATPKDPNPSNQNHRHKAEGQVSTSSENSTESKK